MRNNPVELIGVGIRHLVEAIAVVLFISAIALWCAIGAGA